MSSILYAKSENLGEKTGLKLAILDGKRIILSRKFKRDSIYYANRQGIYSNNIQS